jgi:CheY-like chemotaxis protein
MISSRTFSVSEAAQEVGVESRTLRRWLSQDRLDARRHGGRPSRRELVRALRRRGLPIPENLQPWPRVLVVDDEPDMLKMASWSIESALPDALVVSASDGDAALTRLAALKPNLLVTDLRMPGENDGFALCRRVDAARRLGVRVLVMSGDGSEQARARAFDAGVSEYLVKPFYPEDLVSAVRRVLALLEAPVAD